MEFKIEKCSLSITGNGIKPINEDKFSGKVFNSTNFKIYILKEKNRYLYVGKTKQKIGTKFQQGFRSYRKNEEGKREGGYGGYKWIKEYINKNQPLILFVFDLGASFEKNHTESIEAEIVFEIRKRFGSWPLCQNEIHFFNTYENASSAANEILLETNPK
jgi:hypothetical protein